MQVFIQKGVVRVLSLCSQIPPHQAIRCNPILAANMDPYKHFAIQNLL